MRFNPDMTSDISLFIRSAGLIAQSSGLIIAAGAGMGVDSGLADFRGPEGFWRAYPPLRRAGLRFEEMAIHGRSSAIPVLPGDFTAIACNVTGKRFHTAVSPSCGKSRRVCRTGLSYLQAMWMVIFRKRVLPTKRSARYTVRSIICNAQRPVQTISGRRMNSSLSLIRLPAVLRRHGHAVRIAANWRGRIS